MSIDVQQLSAKQLFELATQKLHQEQKQAQRAELLARVAELKEAQERLIATHEQALAILDREYLALKQKRDQLVADHQAKLVAIEQQINEITSSEPVPVAAPLLSPAPSVIPSTVAPVAPVATSPTVSTPDPFPLPGATPPSRTAPEEGLPAAIVEAMKGRNDISDSLLREKLRVRGYPLGNLNKILEKMVRDGMIASKGGGNYSLKKKA